MRKISIIFILGLLIFPACAGGPPVEELSIAKKALETARDVEAETYALEDYRAAERSLWLAEKEAASNNRKRAVKLSAIASLQADYTIAASKWKKGEEELAKARLELEQLKKEVERAKILLEETRREFE